MTDRELLELAAKAAGYEWRWYFSQAGQLFQVKQHESWVLWSPLQDDGDALRLAVKLGMSAIIKTMPHATYVEVYNGQAPSVMEILEDCRTTAASDPCAATRRAFVRVAAEVGRHLNDR